MKTETCPKDQPTERLSLISHQSAVKLLVICHILTLYLTVLIKSQSTIIYSDIWHSILLQYTLLNLYTAKKITAWIPHNVDYLITSTSHCCRPLLSDRGKCQRTRPQFTDRKENYYLWLMSDVHFILNIKFLLQMWIFKNKQTKTALMPELSVFSVMWGNTGSWGSAGLMLNEVWGGLWTIAFIC